MTKARLLTLLAACLLPLLAFAQGNYPDKPIKLIVPFAPGGVTDTSGRLIAEALAKPLAQPVAGENQAGRAGLMKSITDMRSRRRVEENG